MGLVKGLADGLNYEEMPGNAGENSEPTYYDRNIVGLPFYHNLVVIEKGVNNEGSNIARPRR